MRTTPERIDGLLRPKSIALIGASPRPNSFGNNLIASVDSLGFRGSVHLVNPRYDHIDGRPCYPDIASIADPVDCAVIGLGDSSVVESLEAVAAKGISGAVIFSRAYGNDARGVDRAEAISAIGREAGLAICGANCMGFVNLIDALQVTGLPFGQMAAPSGVAVISHSGSTWSGLVGNQRQLGFDFAISAGQELVTTVSDYVRYLVEYTETRVIACILETLRDPQGFIEAAKAAAARNVPIVVLKLGRSEAGKRFAVSHSGAISGSDAAYKAMFSKFGIVEVQTLDELMDTLELFARARPLTTDGIALGTDSGGERQLIVDIAADIGLPFPELQSDTIAKIEGFMDPGMWASNPLDYWGDGSDFIAPCLSAMAEDSGVGMVVMACNLPPDRPFAEVCFNAICKVHGSTDKPVALMGNISTTLSRPVSERLRRAGIPVLMGTATALAAIKHFRNYAFAKPRTVDDIAPESGTAAAWRKRLLASATTNIRSAVGFAILADYGIEAAQYRDVKSPAEVAAFGDAFGYPIVLKIDDPAIPHKSDVGGVRLGLAGVIDAQRAYAELAEMHPNAPIIAQTQSAGVELVLGMSTDADFGPLITLGMGGVFAEIFKDATTLLPPVSREDALSALKRLKGYPLLAGARGRRRVDLEALCAVVERFSQLGLELSSVLSEIEINPLMVDGNRSVAVDCLAVRHSGVLDG